MQIWTSYASVAHWLEYFWLNLFRKAGSISKETCFQLLFHLVGEWWFTRLYKVHTEGWWSLLLETKVISLFKIRWTNRWVISHAFVWRIANFFIYNSLSRQCTQKLKFTWVLFLSPLKIYYAHLNNFFNRTILLQEL